MKSDRDWNVEQGAAEAPGLQQAAVCFFPGGHRLGGPHDISPGYSDSAFERIEVSGRAWLLRRWPPSFAEERLSFVHLALAESRSRGFSGVPELATTETGETMVQVAGRLYDAQEFLGGEPLCASLSGQNPTPNVACVIEPARLTRLAEALARFHLSTSRLRPAPRYRSASLPERLRSLKARVEEYGEPSIRATRAWGAGEVRDIALRWLALLRDALRTALGVAERQPLGGMAMVLCHADLWPAHVRFGGDYFVGFTDFETLAFASPALDLAQLVAHFGGWEMAETVILSYRTLAPLTEADEATLAPEVVADLAAEGLWALEELRDRPPGISPIQYTGHRLNLELMLSPLEKAAEACARAVR